MGKAHIWSQKEADRLVALRAQGLTWAQAAEKLNEEFEGFHYTATANRSFAVRNGLQAGGVGGPRVVPVGTAPPPTMKEGLEQNFTGDKQVLTVRSSTIRTLDAALKEAKVDLSTWAVDRWVANKWDQGSKGKDSVIQVVELWQVKVWLKRRAPKAVVDALEELFTRLAKKSPKKKVKKHRPVTKNRHLLELALFDSHFGKLAWGMETGTNYDLKIAATVYANAIHDLLDRVSGYRIERILLPVGQDFFHVNNWLGTTAAGTQMDMDSRFQKIFEVGAESVQKAMDAALAVAPVKIVWVPGNHDPATSWYLVKFLEAWYRKTGGVTVDSRPTFRKYERYGTNLIGFTHGDEEPHRDLPAIMASEVPGDWAATTCRAWHLGHTHKKAETRYNAGDTFGAVAVTVLPSLCGTDAWHYKKGYVKNRRAAEAYLWGHDDGYVGHFSANAKD